MILMSGPCVIESLDQLRKIAEGLRPVAENENIDFYFKASFDKANRTSLEAYRGLGIDEGLKMLSTIKKEFGYKIITDIHEREQAKALSEVVDIIQIPAFLCRQTDLIVEVAKTKCIVNIKKGQFMNPVDMKYGVLKALKTRDPKITEANFEDSKKHGIWLTERGNSFGYGALVVDMRSLIIMRDFAPTIFDATHSVQAPGALGGKSGGDSKFAPILARGAAAVGVDGFFMETHYDPEHALSDGPNMIPTKDMESLILTLIRIQNQIPHAFRSRL
ncbi:3-deoxy-8-phosphooctulonate synthase [Helicobacter sp. 13S00401-1]|uniref:3-deoxy-8-phosphooctulonate synthase n=1 Tax=Helicobacter sp. 13S00401-1 TaxID=1905758 RepID=UPI000BA6C68F|nr:3-deoxy-8-phosphooctulonate synthase [Helicobacter sp. 13S00401-1]PAF50056.1 3-deoxy-8-phosphooctulonate synthase [Helicobacter sp. 13S00401-1]